MQIEQVKVVSDDNGHWYVIPNSLIDDFEKDLLNEELCKSGEFSEKYELYATGDCINNVQLFAEVKNEQETEQETEQ